MSWPGARTALAEDLSSVLHTCTVANNPVTPAPGDPGALFASMHFTHTSPTRTHPSLHVHTVKVKMEFKRLAKEGQGREVAEGLPSMNGVWDAGFWPLLNGWGRQKSLMWLYVGVKDRDTVKDSGMEEEPGQGVITKDCSSLGELGRGRKNTALTPAFRPVEI